MRISVIIEQRFLQTPDGAIWTPCQFPYGFWRPYLKVFNRVNIVARVASTPESPTNWERADGERVGITPIPHYIGPLDYARKRRQVARACREAVSHRDAVSLRLGSILAIDIAPTLRASGHPYGVDVVSDPFDALAAGSMQHPLRPFLRWYLFRETRSICSHASAGSYVTRRYLQLRYPTRSGSPSFSASDVMLPEDAIASAPRTFIQKSGPYRLLFVGSLQQRYKGLHILLEGLAGALRAGADLELAVIGGGRQREGLERWSRKTGIDSRVSFRGEIPRSAVLRELDRADLFVLPSFTEGLPRALIEAMSRGLPCIATRVGGTPELLTSDALVEKGDAPALKNKILEFVNDRDLMARHSAHNLARAADFRSEVCMEQITAYLSVLKNQTQDWLSGRTHGLDPK